MASQAKVLAVANQKGGVGKTTTVVNLGAYLARAQKRVLLIDVDPQANATHGLNRTPGDQPGLYQVLVENTDLSAAILPADSGMSLIASVPDLAGAEVELLDAPNRESTLRVALEPILADFDYILLDCPPSLGLLTVNALVAADGVLIPVQCEYLALEGVSRINDTVGRVQSALNPELSIFGVVMTMYDRRTVLSEQVATEIRRHYGGLVFETVIPRNVRLGEAPSFGQSIAEYDPGSSGAQAYLSLASEVMKRG